MIVEYHYYTQNNATIYVDWRRVVKYIMLFFYFLIVGLKVDYSGDMWRRKSTLWTNFLSSYGLFLQSSLMEKSHKVLYNSIEGAN